MNIILFSTADWDNPFWTNKQHTAVQLAELGFKVLYVESFGLRQPKLKSTDLTRIFKRLFKSLRGTREVRSGLFVYSPLLIPFHRFAVVRAINSVLLKQTLRFLKWKLKLNQPILWTYHPMILEVMNALDRSKLIYHSVDDLSAAPGIDSESILTHEQELLKKVDLVFCTSRKLEAHCRKIAGNKVHFFANVVDYDHFSKAKSILIEPSELTSIPRPRIGFVGAISEYKVDFASIIQVAKQHSEWHWVMIGKVGEGQPTTSESELLSQLQALPNLHFVGPKTYESLPQYLSAFDVATIPCPENDYTQAMFPMKFFEYMAAGKPIVARLIDSLKEYQEYFYAYRSAQELEEQISAALKFKVRAPEQSQKLALENTWQKRLEKMLKLIDSL